ncbi:MAG: cation:proton antiporter [Oscillospiraceae bacterium]|nr:cation:proton antiporter [Oscillospiraceae bacterium]
MQFNVLCYLAIMIFSGMAFGRLVKLIKLPNVTGYLLAGLILGPSVLKIIPKDTIDGIAVISEVALGFIAFSIGNEFKMSYFKKVGASPIVIAVFEALFAVICVCTVLVLFGNDLPFSLVLSSIAAATAPAATIMVIRQYKAKGPVTETLLSVVALDDAAALMLFGISVAVAGMLNSTSNISVLSMILSPILEIVGALVIGAVLGMILTYFIRFFKKDGNRLSLAVGFVFIGIGIADMTGVSSLLLCMALGATFVNFSKQALPVMKVVDAVTPPIFMLFFVASGAALDLSVLPMIGIVGVIYVILRVVGKVLGTYLGATICKCDKKIKKYLGYALLPQAGVAIGLSLAATTVVPSYGQTIRAVVLCATFIYELIGPGITKIALKKAGEIE